MIEFIFFVVVGLIANQLYKKSETYRKWVDDPFGVSNNNHREV